MTEQIRKIIETVQIESPLHMADGRKVSTEADWKEQQTYIRRMLEEHVYGTMPPFGGKIHILSQSDEKILFDGKVREKVYMITEENMYEDFRCGVRIVAPNRQGRFPAVFMVMGGSSGEDFHNYGFVEEIVLRHGYALVFVDREQAAPDIPDADTPHWVKNHYGDYGDPFVYYCSWRKRKQTFPDASLPLDKYMEQYPYTYKYGKIALGAHCVRLAVSLAVEEGYADERYLVSTGHSRDGKVAMCAAVYDERIGVAVPHGSGCGGNCILRFLTKGAEQIDDMVQVWPSWFPPFAKYLGKNDAIPIDMHMARACIAPRAVLNTDGRSDFWAGPFAAYVCKEASQEAFDYLGVPEHNGMFLRDGGHHMSDDDIAHMMMFCDHVFFDKETDYDFWGEKQL